MLPSERHGNPAGGEAEKAGPPSPALAENATPLARGLLHPALTAAYPSVGVLAPSGPHRSLSLCGGAGRGRPACNFILAGDRLAVSVMRNLSLTQKPLVCIWINKDRYFVGDEAFVVAQAD